jgi:hypothetical protein
VPRFLSTKCIFSGRVGHIYKVIRTRGAVSYRFDLNSKQYLTEQEFKRFISRMMGTLYNSREKDRIRQRRHYEKNKERINAQRRKHQAVQ